MAAADPAADLRGWAQAPLTLTGAPAVATALAGDPPETLDWNLVGAPDSLNDRFRVDDVRLYEGLTRVGEAGLSRIYTVLARRGTLAWHVELALGSAFPPGPRASSSSPRTTRARAGRWARSASAERSLAFLHTLLKR